MDFVIKLMQLAIKKYIQQFQSKLRAPSHVAIFIDLKIMFNLIFYDKLLKIIQHRYPELYPFTQAQSILNGTTGCGATWPWTGP